MNSEMEGEKEGYRKNLDKALKNFDDEFSRIKDNLNILKFLGGIKNETDTNSRRV